MTYQEFYYPGILAKDVSSSCTILLTVFHNSWTQVTLKLGCLQIYEAVWRTS